MNGTNLNDQSVAIDMDAESVSSESSNTYFCQNSQQNSSSHMTSTSSDPIRRTVVLERHPETGFGFVAGSEKPVIVRFVKEGGPSEGKLMSEDYILEINGEDVSKAPRDRVIELVKTCRESLTMTVCQPPHKVPSVNTSNNSPNTRKSSLLTAAKKAKLKSNPSRVRFAEGVLVNGNQSQLSTTSSQNPSAFSSFDSCVPFMPNVLKVFLENGQTKTFKYDSGTLVQDVLTSLIEKLSIKNPLYYSLCVEHVKARRRNKLTLLDPKDSLSKIANLPGAHNLRCLFRVVFVPKDISELLLNDPVSFEYFYAQSCNDIVQERFSPELKYEIALRLSSLHLLQHSLSTGAMTSQGTKVNLKIIEKTVTLKPFLPYTLMETMKSKELHKLLNHYLKQNAIQLCPPGQKTLTSLQAKVHYLRIISELPSYGAKVFAMNIRESMIESALLISRKYGLSHVTGLRNSLPVTLARIEDITAIKLTQTDDYAATGMISIEIHLRNISAGEVPFLRFSLEERDAEELVLTLKGYHRLMLSHDSLTTSVTTPTQTSLVLQGSTVTTSTPQLQIQHPHPPPLMTPSLDSIKSSVPLPASGYKDLPVMREMMVEAVNSEQRYHLQQQQQLYQQNHRNSMLAVNSIRCLHGNDDRQQHRPQSPPPPNSSVTVNNVHHPLASINASRLHSRFNGVITHTRQESDDSQSSLTNHHNHNSLLNNNRHHHLSGRVVLPRVELPVRSSSLHPRIRSMSTSPAPSPQNLSNTRTVLQGITSGNTPLGLTNNNGNNTLEGDQGMKDRLIRDQRNGQIVSEEDDNDSHHDVKEDKKIRTSCSGDSDIDLPSIVSMEILESAIVAETKEIYRRDDVEKRVAEMHKIVADAQNYLHSSAVRQRSHESLSQPKEKEIQVNNDDSDSLQSNEEYGKTGQRSLYSENSRALDSLVLIRNSNGGPSLTQNPSHARLTQLTRRLGPGSNSSATESESESVSTEQENRSSPVYSTQNSFQNSVKSSVTDPLHLPLDSLPNLTDAENELIETLKKLQSGIDDDEEDDNDLYNDPGISVQKMTCSDDGESSLNAQSSSLEIIDLTALPPPGEEDYENLSFCNPPLTSSSCLSTRVTNDCMTATNESTTSSSSHLNRTTHSPSRISSISGNEKTRQETSSSSSFPSSCNSTAVSDCCLTATLDASSTGQDNGDNLVETQHLHEEDEDTEAYRNALILGSQFEEFLASVSIPPPPSMINRMLLPGNLDDEEDEEYENIPYLSRDRETPFHSNMIPAFDEEELSSLIVPPPPSHTQEGNDSFLLPQDKNDDVIANFWKATRDVKKIYAAFPVNTWSNGSSIGDGKTFSQNTQMFIHHEPPVSSSSSSNLSQALNTLVPRNDSKNGFQRQSGSCSDSGYDSIPLVVNSSSSGREAEIKNNPSNTHSMTSSSLTTNLVSSSSETSLSSSASFCTVPSVHHSSYSENRANTPAVIPRASIMTMNSSSPSLQANKTSSSPTLGRDIVSNTGAGSMRTTVSATKLEETADLRNGRDDVLSETQRSSTAGTVTTVDGSIMTMDERDSRNSSQGSSSNNGRQSQDQYPLSSSSLSSQERTFHDECHYTSIETGKSHTMTGKLNGNNKSIILRTSNVDSGTATHLLDMMSSPIDETSLVSSNPYSSEGVTMLNIKEIVPSPPTRSSKPPIPPASQSIIERRKQLLARKTSQTKGKNIAVSGSCLQENSVDEDEDGDDEDSTSERVIPHDDNQHHHPTSSASSTSSCTSSSSDSSGLFNFNITNLMLTKSFGADAGKKRQSQDLSSLFIQVVAKIDQMITHMEEVHECRIIRADDHNCLSEKSSQMYPLNNAPMDEQQLNQARDCLVLESRAFVTSSKLFVKSSTEGLDSLDMIDHLVDCLSLLEKMYKVSNIILFNCESQVQSTCLVDRLKEVAATFALTIETVRRLFLIRQQPNSILHSIPENPASLKQQESQSGVLMGQLMSHATSLATSLSALMRTLRAFSSY